MHLPTTGLSCVYTHTTTAQEHTGITTGIIERILLILYYRKNIIDDIERHTEAHI